MQLSPPSAGATNRHGTALLLVDVFSEFDFEDGPRIASRLHERLPALVTLADRARGAEVPVVYVNDNWGHWRSQQSELVQRAIDGTPEGAAIGRQLRPDPSDYFVLKPRHSGFYGTPLEMLLECLGVARLVLAGTTTNSCVWFTAADAHVRGYRIVVAADATVATDDELERCSLHLMQSTLGAEVLPAARIDFTARHD